MNSHELTQLATVLDQATLEVREVERLTLTHPNLTLDEAYQIQDIGISKRFSRGEKQVGFKMGLTSDAKRRQMNLDSPIYGVLTDAMQVQDRGVFSLEKSIHPKIEPEIAFLIGRDVRAPLSREEAIQVCSGVCAAMEILDSRFLNFKYFSLPDVVADNCSSAYFVLSEEVLPISQVDLADLEMVMEANGVVAQKASSSAISGHPLQSLIQLSEMLSARGLILPAGSIVLAGAATQAIPLEPSIEVTLRVQGLGSTSLKVARSGG